MADREVAFNQQINAFVPKIGNPHFYYAQMIVGKKLIQQASTASMKGMVSKGRFEKIYLIAPPEELQNEFAIRRSCIENIIMSNQASLSDLNSLFTSLQHRAFRGEL